MKRVNVGEFILTVERQDIQSHSNKVYAKLNYHEAQQGLVIHPLFVKRLELFMKVRC